MVSERRRYPRHYAVVADYRLISQPGPIKACQVKDISAVGICIIVYEGLQVGAELEFKVYLPADIFPIIAQGKAVWIKQIRAAGELRVRFDVGIEFTKIEPFDQQKIGHYVASAAGSKLDKNDPGYKK